MIAGLFPLALLVGGCTSDGAGTAPPAPSSSATSASTAATVPMTTVLLSVDGGAADPADLAVTVQILQQRLAPISGATVQAQGADQILITVPATGQRRALASVQPAQLTFRAQLATGPGGVPAAPGASAVDGPTSTAAPVAATAVAQPTGDAAKWTDTVEAGLADVVCDELPRARPDDPALPLLTCTDEVVSLFGPAFLTGADVEQAVAELSPTGGGWVINLTFDADAATRWQQYTTDHVGDSIGLVLDGAVVFAPVIQAPITTASTQIAGAFTEDEAAGLAASLSYGALPLTLTVEG